MLYRGFRSGPAGMLDRIVFRKRGQRADTRRSRRRQRRQDASYADAEPDQKVKHFQAHDGVAPAAQPLLLDDSMFGRSGVAATAGRRSSISMSENGQTLIAPEDKLPRCELPCIDGPEPDHHAHGRRDSLPGAGCARRSFRRAVLRGSDVDADLLPAHLHSALSRTPSLPILLESSTGRT